MTERNNGNYEMLISKLDQFVRKYYLNKLIKGALYTTGLVLAMFVLYSALEYNFYFSTGARKFMFFSFIATSLAGLGYWVLNPLLSYAQLGGRISHEQAASIIGDHFPDVKDKLLNVLQLKRQQENSSSPDLIFASINQKTESIKLVPFKRAIDLNANRKYLRYALPPLLLLLVLLVAAPSVIRDGSTRILKNGTEFERDAPFKFIIADEEGLQVEQYKDFLLEVSTEGQAVPGEVFVEIGEYQYRLKKTAPEKFTYRFRNVHQDQEFKIFSGIVSSDDYTLEVLKKPNLVSFDIKLDYPSYTRRVDEDLENMGDLVVPVGTKIHWDLQTMNTDSVAVSFAAGERLNIERRGSDLFSVTRTVGKDNGYTLYLSNAQLGKADSVSYNINVIPDLYPKITVDQFVDSVDNSLVFYVGTVSDDYGVKNLTFNYRITEENLEEQELQTFPLSVQKGTQFQFDYTFDIRDLQLTPGQQLTYYFEVFDNDGVNGSKSTKSNILTFKKPTIEEFKESEKANSEDIKETLKKSLKESKKIQEEMREMREKLLQEKSLEWQDKKELEKLMQRQQDLQNELQKAQELYEENMENQQEYEERTEEQMEKQEKMEEFFEELQKEELEEMMEKLQEKMEEMQKEEALEMLEDFEMDEEELQKELDRLMELFKQMEVQEELEEQLEKIQELAEEQKELSEETEQKSDEESTEEQQQKQEEIKEEFEKIAEEMEELQEKNKDLEKPQDMKATEKEEMEKVEQDMQNSQDQMEQKKNEKAAKSQKSAAERMQEMAQQMQQQMQQGQMQQMEEDMASLRQLLENLVTLSFDQEDNIDGLARTSIATPRYVSLVQDQFKIKDDFKVVEDTLHALSKRVVEIESFVSEKVAEVKENLDESIDQLEERKKSVAAEHQQRTMKNLNDLALMLSEVMNQMQQQMSTMMPGSQMCDKPGQSQGEQQGRMPMDKITKGQEQLNKDMKEMQKGMSEGEKGTSEQFAKMAAQQAALRKALRDMADEKKQQGKGDETLENTIEQMDKVETELVNKSLTNEMMKRQEEILTKLLEAEKAEREREMDSKRKAETALQVRRELPPSLAEYIKKREAEIESFQTVSPALKPYYKFLVEEYYDAMKNQ